LGTEREQASSSASLTRLARYLLICDRIEVVEARNCASRVSEYVALGHTPRSLASKRHNSRREHADECKRAPITRAKR